MKYSQLIYKSGNVAYYSAWDGPTTGKKLDMALSSIKKALKV